MKFAHEYTLKTDLVKMNFIGHAFWAFIWALMDKERMRTYLLGDKAVPVSAL